MQENGGMSAVGEGQGRAVTAVKRAKLREEGEAFLVYHLCAPRHHDGAYESLVSGTCASSCGRK